MRPSSGRASPTVWMLAAVACNAPLPLLIWVGVRDTSPLLFTGVWYTAGCAAHAAAVRAGGGKRATILSDVRSAPLRYLWAGIALRSGWFFFAAAVAVSTAEVVTVVFEMWPAMFAATCMTKWWRNKMQGSARLDRSASVSTLVFLLIGISGVALAVLSDSSPAVPGGTHVGGIVLAALAAAAAAVGAAAAQVMGAAARPDADGSETQVSRAERSRISASGTALAQGVLGVGFMGAAGAAWLLGHKTPIGVGGMAAAICAAILYAAGNLFFHHANHSARDALGQAAARVNSLYYLVPVGALILLALFADTHIARPDLLIAGAAGIVAVNMVMHLDPEGTGTRQGRGGHGYRSAVLALWGAGVLVLFRDDWLPERWEVWSAVEYWGMIGVLATVLALLFSFRQSRLSELRRGCDDLTLSVHHRLDIMRRTGRLPLMDASRAMRDLRDVDRASRPDRLASAFLSLRARLARFAYTADSHAEADLRVGLLADVERLVALRQQGRGFAEPAVLTMIAAVTAAAAIVVRPAGVIVPFAGFAHDTVSMIVAAAVLFLGFDLIETRHALDTPTFRRIGSGARIMHGQPPGWRLELAAYADRRTERAVSATLGAVLLIGAVIMLAAKWLA